MAYGLEAIDWAAPWLEPWRARGEPLAQSIAANGSCASALNAVGENLAHCPVRFVAQDALATGQAYEAFIFHTRQVPTRDGLHDFFNGLCWLQFPKAKARLNQLQATQIASTGINPVRGPARDALTVFDENAALLQAPDSLWEALAAKDWESLFGSLRPLWQQSRLVLFGHALLEKLVHPRKAITAHVYRVPASEISLQDWDAWLGETLNAEVLATKPFAHLPVLGVPQWWADNAAAEFYADPSVFRPPR